MSEYPDQVTDPESPTQEPAPAAAGVPDPTAEEELAAAVAGTFPDDDSSDASGEGDAPHTELLEVDDPRTREELIVAAHEAERQRDEYLDDLRRARAEFENFRRRTGRESAAARDAGRGDVASALLEVLDDLDRTLAASEGSADETLVKGVSLVAEKLSSTLAGLGLVRIDPLDDPFDPSLHEAVQHLPADEPTDAPVVDSTLRPGYRLGDRVLRPAMVVVRG
ncbi:nucleotide exchange factor GrpE [Nitriliruptor alkaliphilus]|uniref:nucleotide exchange factor GrpE n=1 Tax=Nitriliruptor alkaliphilus TaxID=427918 RepID=UPI0006968760|nr:nucleotide exchange factor GrpE [Nitriliruptor alkaliphilus]